MRMKDVSGRFAILVYCVYFSICYGVAASEREIIESLPVASSAKSQVLCQISVKSLTSPVVTVIAGVDGYKIISAGKKVPSLDVFKEMRKIAASGGVGVWFLVSDSNHKLACLEYRFPVPDGGEVVVSGIGGGSYILPTIQGDGNGNGKDTQKQPRTVELRLSDAGVNTVPVDILAQFKSQKKLPWIAVLNIVDNPSWDIVVQAVDRVILSGGAYVFISNE
jgi:hypothetical protein